MKRIDDFVYEFDSFEDLNSYAKNKYGKNAAILSSKNYTDSHYRIYAISFPKFETVTIKELNICVKDLKITSSEICSLISPLNYSRSLRHLYCHTDGSHIILLSTVPIKGIEIAIVVIDKEKHPDWMDILYDIDVRSVDE